MSRYIVLTASEQVAAHLAMSCCGDALIAADVQAPTSVSDVSTTKSVP